MGFYQFIAGFFDVRNAIKARIFLSSLVVTIVITVLISVYWYQRLVQSMTDTIMDNTNKNVSTSLARLEDSFRDVRLMHYTIINESTIWNYLVREEFHAPSYEWFNSYLRLYNAFQMMGNTMSRIISGTGANEPPQGKPCGIFNVHALFY